MNSLFWNILKILAIIGIRKIGLWLQSENTYLSIRGENTLSSYLKSLELNEKVKVYFKTCVNKGL